MSTCNKCGCVKTSCGCATVSSSCCDEVSVNHGDTIVYVPSGNVFTIEKPFTIPACNDTGVVTVLADITMPPSGATLFLSKNGKVAYLTVIGTTKYHEDGNLYEQCGSGEISKHAYKTEVTVENKCLNCTTLEPGTSIEQGSPVMLDAPNCTGAASGSSDLVLCDKLHVPEVGLTETVEVSPSTSSLSINDIVQITDKKFRVDSIPTSTSVELANDGEGGDPGTVIDGSDCSSVKIFLVAGDNPCDKADVAEGDGLLVCTPTGQAPLQLDEGEVAYKTGGKIVGVALPESDVLSTTFTGCITLDPALSPQRYTIIVPSIAEWQINDTGYFDCDAEKRIFKVIGLVGSVINLEPQFSVTEIESIADDCTGCKFIRESCCIINSARMDEICTVLERCTQQPTPLGAVGSLAPFDDITFAPDIYLTAGVFATETMPNAAAFDGTNGEFIANNDQGTANDGTYDNAISYVFTNPFPDCQARVDLDIDFSATFLRVAANGRWQMDILFEDDLATINANDVDNAGGVYGAAVTELVGAKAANYELTHTVNLKTSIFMPPASEVANISKVIIGRVRVLDPGDNPALVSNLPMKMRGYYYPACDCDCV